MKTLLVIGFCFSFLQVSAQIRVDTLIIGNKKIKLYPVQKYYDSEQTGPVLLISEYEEEKMDQPLIYNFYDTVEYTILENEDVNIFGTEISFSGFKPEIRISKNTDSITLDGNLKYKPYIKVDSFKYHFCAVEMYRLRNDTLTKYNLMSTRWPLELFFHPFFAETRPIFGDRYILKYIYYRRGFATYFLNRSLILKIE